ncbi:MAG: hypothetical protein AAB316_18785, partial [Bacteroidota bacterium]
ANTLLDLTPGFNLATAHQNIDAQITEGVRVNVVTYLSARHHQEAYVKGGYIQFDEMPFFNSPTVDKLMDNLTLKFGHYEINYGDAHYRRSDNGAALYNPFVENLILDAFNTEIGAEAVYQNKGLIFVGGITNGDIKGDVVKIPDLKPEDVDDSSKKSPSWIGKLGYDKQVNDDLRVRLTGSVYYTGSSKANNLYGGDRAGSRYYLVLENTKASTSANFYSGRFSPRYSDKVFAGMANLFLKYKGVEFFGTYENANGRLSSEADMRNATQLAGELVFRFGKNEQFFVGGRYNTLKAELPKAGNNFGVDNPVQIDRIQASAGWFLNKYVLAKFEYVTQEYKDYPSTHIYNGGKFNGFMFEAVVGF